MIALYNEIEPYAADWLLNLSAAGHIAPGAVDARSIRELRSDDLVDATQFHTFAGIGAWSYALRLAGWPDDRPVWTGSCPCQPFSGAGKGLGFDDPRHLWPEWFRLIRECRPPVVFGEQVASGDGLAWLDVVRADLEGEGYAVGAADLCAAGVGAPHIRQRLFFGAVRLAGAKRVDGLRQHGHGMGGPARGGEGQGHQRQRVRPHPADGGAVDVVADPQRAGLQARPPADLRGAGRGEEGREPGEPRVVDGRMADTWREGRQQVGADARGSGGGGGAKGLEQRPVHRSPWDGPDWLPCRDGKARPVEPGTFPLAHGAPARVGRLRAYGNAIVPQVAAGFVRAFMEANP